MKIALIVDVSAELFSKLSNRQDFLVTGLHHGDWRRADAIFDQALDAAPEDRAELVKRLCGHELDLLRQVEKLLEADRQASDFLESPATLAYRLGNPEALRLGPYRLLRRLGEGGMGEVFLAVRDDDLYHRKVAVKRIARHAAHPELERRFARERRMLANLEHANIARLYDAGFDDGDHPYLVMEYVEGRPIDRYCDEERCDIAQRLELFLDLCSAVQHAHRGLLIHRDLKPSNVLVSEDGSPKLLDFGIAKTLSESEESLRTRTGARLLTPSYASPEQIRGEPMTTASDIFSLGVLLYELLVAVSPHQSGEVAAVEWAVCNVTPARPSQRFAALPADEQRAIAGRRGLTTAGMLRRLRGDLDLVVMAALRPEPVRRYGSVQQFADDLCRFLEDRPITARPDSWRYRSRKWVHRHQLGTAFAVTLAISGLAFVIAQGHQNRRLALERDKASQALALLIETFKSSAPETADGRTITARQVLDAAVGRIDRELTDQAELQATMLDAVGQVYTSLGLLDDAGPLLQRALDQRRSRLGAESLDTVASEQHLGELELLAGRVEAAEPLFRHALEVRRRELRPGAPEIGQSWVGLGSVLARRDASDQAEEALRQGLAVFRAAREDQSLAAAEALLALAGLTLRRGDYEGAETLYQEALEIQRSRLGPRHVTVAGTLSAIAVVPAEQGRPGDAEAILQEAVSIQQEKLPPGHPNLVESWLRLGRSIIEQGRPAEAEAIYRQALDQADTYSSEPTLRLADGYSYLGSALMLQFRFDEARAAHERALQYREHLLGSRAHVEVGESLFHLARLDLLAEDYKQAEARYRESYDIVRGFLGDDHPDVAHPLAALGEAMAQAGKLKEGCQALEDALAIRRHGLPAEHWWIPVNESRLGGCRHRQGEIVVAEDLLSRSYRALAERFAPTDKRVMDARRRLADHYAETDRLAEASRLRQLPPPL